MSGDIPNVVAVQSLRRPFTSLEICAGAGGQALGLERAGFEHLALVENDFWSCETLRSVPAWRGQVFEADVRTWDASSYLGEVDLFAGGVPCPPFSRAGRRRGPEDERDLFPRALELIRQCRPRGILLENVRGLLSRTFDQYRSDVIEGPLREMGYEPKWEILQASNFGVPQLRPRVVMVALRPSAIDHFSWPEATVADPLTVGEALRDEMGSRGWGGTADWALRAQGVAPTLVGGSKKHGGPDLGPTQAKKRWSELGVDGRLIALEPPDATFPRDGSPTLTVRMAALIQGFPVDWPFQGRKTAAYRQVGNAFPPPVAEAVARQIAAAFDADDQAMQAGLSYRHPEDPQLALAM